MTLYGEKSKCVEISELEINNSQMGWQLEILFWVNKRRENDRWTWFEMYLQMYFQIWIMKKYAYNSLLFHVKG